MSASVPKARKKRFFFRTRDDLLFLRTLLDDREAVLSLNRSERSTGWEAVTAKLNSKGIEASTHTLRCRLKRLVNSFSDEIGQGTQAADFTGLERLLDQYVQAEAQLEQQIAESNQRPRALEQKNADTTQRPLAVSNPTHNSSDSDSEDNDAAVTELRPQRRSLSPPTEPVSAPAPSASVQSTPESGRKTRKRRFFFQDRHDVLLLTAVLADEGVRGARKPSWKDITASFNDHGLDVNAHTLRTHLRLLVDKYREEASSLDTDPARITAKQKLLRKYCRKLDAQEEQDRSDNDVSSAPGPETGSQVNESNDDQSFEPEDVSRAGTNRQEVAERVREPARLSPSHATVLVRAAAVANLSQVRGLITASTQTSEPASSSTSVDEASSTTETSTCSDTRETSVQTEEASSTPTATHDRSTTEPAADNETEEVTEPAWKRQKLELETILQRFVSEQSERQREEREQERARLSEQQDLQRQTIELQKRALDMQENAMNMQDRLMSLMEKVMDKLN